MSVDRKNRALIRRRRVPRGRFVLPAMTVLLGLWGCAGEPVQIGASTRSVGAEQAYLLPPPGSFAISGVIEQRYSNAVEQKIFLTTDSAISGSNVVEVRLFGTKSPRRFGEDALRFKPLTERIIANDVHAALPGVRMVRSDYVVQNEYGTFGYAMGRPSAGELCMYAWQQLRSQQSSNPFNDSGAIQLRVRLCRTGASEADLLAFMYGFSIAASVDNPGWNPFGTPAKVPDRLGRTGDPVYPFPSATVLPTVDATVTKSTGGSAPRPAARTVPTKTVTPQAAASNLPRVTVPSPTASGAGAPAAASTAATRTAPAAVLPQTLVPSPACVSANGTLLPGCS